MASSQTDNTEEQGDLSDIKRKLAWRMGFAALMIVGLLGGLALFDYLSAPERDAETSAPQFSEPVPVAKKVQTQPVIPAEPEAEKDEKKVSAPESSAPPVDASAPALEPPPRPSVAAQPASQRSVQSPARPASPVSTAVTAVPARPAEAKATPAAAPAARAEVPVMPNPPQSPPAPPKLFSGYALQAGVFSDPRRAEELHAKLTLEGIHSTIEARVQVGPFKTRAEADAARVKLKALGIDALMLTPKGVKH